MRSLIVGWLVAALLGTATTLAAPAPKEKVVDDGPVTEEQLKQSSDRLMHVALAWHNFESATGKFPGNIMSKDGKPLLSWRVAVLQYMGDSELALFTQFKLDEPWNSAHNAKLLEQMPTIYAPVRRKGKFGQTYYQSLGGNGGILQPGGLPIGAVTDGLSNTLLAIEAARPVAWTKPEDLDAGKIEPKLIGGMFNGEAFATMADGSIRKIKSTINVRVLRAIATRCGGEVLD